MALMSGFEFQDQACGYCAYNSLNATDVVLFCKQFPHILKAISFTNIQLTQAVVRNAGRMYRKTFVLESMSGAPALTSCTMLQVDAAVAASLYNIFAERFD